MKWLFKYEIKTTCRWLQVNDSSAQPINSNESFRNVGLWEWINDLFKADVSFRNETPLRVARFCYGFVWTIFVDEKAQKQTIIVCEIQLNNINFLFLDLKSISHMQSFVLSLKQQL